MFRNRECPGCRSGTGLPDTCPDNSVSVSRNEREVPDAAHHRDGVDDAVHPQRVLTNVRSRSGGSYMHDQGTWRLEHVLFCGFQGAMERQLLRDL